MTTTEIGTIWRQAQSFQDLRHKKRIRRPPICTTMGGGLCFLSSKLIKWIHLFSNSNRSLKDLRRDLRGCIATLLLLWSGSDELILMQHYSANAIFESAATVQKWYLLLTILSLFLIENRKLHYVHIFASDCC